MTYEYSLSFQQNEQYEIGAYAQPSCNEVLYCKFSKLDIANMLRRIMSYVILSNTSVLTTELLAMKVAKNITEEDLSIVIEYILSNNQYIAKLYQPQINNNIKK